MTVEIEEQINNLQRMVEDECSRRCILEAKLEIATKALKEISVSLWDEMECRDCAKKVLKEMEEV